MVRELICKKVKGVSHSSMGFVISQLPCFKSGKGFVCKVAWDVTTLKEAQSLPEDYHSDEHSDDIELVSEE